ncbi:hypothetical protein CJF31_00010951 [Rutstroemia sp. NJR-2017a BVV2]|nr:hypothetical protein CJF31_00010951 [Rutstroemia sp. NJR-2017a BVV2]
MSANTTDTPLPWVENVVVVGAHKDENNHPMAKVAVCTIDTGNMQGDIVSKDFLENQLGFPKSRFRELKGTEKRGAVVGNNIPEAAIHLTWYHKKGSRAFHDMRFLIAPHSDADLVIGAQSIWKYNLLTVPYLMSKNVAKEQVAMSTGNNKKDEGWASLGRNFNSSHIELLGIETRKRRAQDDKRPKEYDLDAKRFEICTAERDNVSKELLDTIKEQLEELIMDAKCGVEDSERAADSEAQNGKAADEKKSFQL